MFNNKTLNSAHEHGVSEVTWLEKLLKELQVTGPSSPAVVYCDNLSTVQLVANPILHARTKHVEIDYYFVREKVMNGTINVYHVPSETQLANPLTKVIPTKKFLIIKNQLTVLSRPKDGNKKEKEGSCGKKERVSLTQGVEAKGGDLKLMLPLDVREKVEDDIGLSILRNDVGQMDKLGLRKDVGQKEQAQARPAHTNGIGHPITQPMNMRPKKTGLSYEGFKQRC